MNVIFSVFMCLQDAHNCILDFDEDTSMFAVYDGHGGNILRCTVVFVASFSILHYILRIMFQHVLSLTCSILLGEEVALYCSKYLPEIIKEQKTYKDGKLQKVNPHSPLFCSTDHSLDSPKFVL